MCFLVTAFAAVVSTILWYANAPKDTYKLGTLSLIYWGATLMWSVDRVIAYFTGGRFLEITLDSALLGVCVVLLGLFVWLITLLISDPKGVFKKLLKKY